MPGRHSCVHCCAACKDVPQEEVGNVSSRALVLVVVVVVVVAM